MEDMMDLVEKVKSQVIKDIDVYKNTFADHYDFWNEHIKYVYEESINLAKKYNANLEIVALGSLLHDIALIRRVGSKKDHHINGKIIAEKILKDNNCPPDILNRVSMCVYNHRSSKNATTIEELCVSDADILAHFDNIPMLFNSAFNIEKLNLNEVNSWLKEVFQKDYNDLSEKTKELFKERYKMICEIIISNKN